MAADNVWLIDPEAMTREWMGQTEKALRARLLNLFEQYRAEIETYMRRNAPWTDRTTDLRQTLYADIKATPNVITLSFDYGLDYGRYLEFRHDFNGRFAIVNPTFDIFAPKFYADVERILNDL